MDELTQSGWIKDLPPEWMGGKYAFRRLCQLLEERFKTAELAPWSGKPDAEQYCRFWGGTEQDAVHSINLNEHAIAVFHRAFLMGEVSPSLFDGHAFKLLPKAAFAHSSVVRNGLQSGKFDLDPLWPDEWWSWNSLPWVLSKAEFEAWLRSSRPYQVDCLPARVEISDDERLAALTIREPSQRTRVSLSEAVSWIAFGVALEATRFEMALQWDRLADGDLREAQRKAERAGADLMAAGADDQIAFFGRHVVSRSEKGATNAGIDPVQLDDYRAFVIGRDDLYYGNGLHRTYSDKNSSHWKNSDRDDLFSQVTVSRADLLRHFPPKTDNMKALLAPLPVSIPDIGLVMGLDEVLCRTAYGRPSYDTDVWQRQDRSLYFTDPDGNEIRTDAVGEMPPHIVAYLNASRVVCAALRDGYLVGYIAPTNDPPLSIARLYWNGVNPKYPDLVYRGMSPEEQGAGCPILLSRTQFDAWRPALAASTEPAKQAKPRAERKRPGPAPDSDWPHAITKVTRDCIAAGYTRDLKRGQKAAIQTMLLSYMADRNKHFSDDIAAKHAEKVVAELPDN